MILQRLLVFICNMNVDKKWVKQNGYCAIIFYPDTYSRQDVVHETCCEYFVGLNMTSWQLFLQNFKCKVRASEFTNLTR